MGIILKMEKKMINLFHFKFFEIKKIQVWNGIIPNFKENLKIKLKINKREKNGMLKSIFSIIFSNTKQ